jgi:hypothetical protein
LIHLKARAAAFVTMGASHEGDAMKARAALAVMLLIAGGFAGAQDPTPKTAPPHGSMHGAAPTPSVPVGRIEKSSAADGRTVAEVVANKGALKDKSVTVRGQVVKVSHGILGKNWLHLQDGSGSADKGTNDILVTTADDATVGQVVNASGTVRTDVDIGKGYKYAVLVEEAKLRK